MPLVFTHTHTQRNLWISCGRDSRLFHLTASSTSPSTTPTTSTDVDISFISMSGVVVVRQGGSDFISLSGPRARVHSNNMLDWQSARGHQVITSGRHSNTRTAELRLGLRSNGEPTQTKKQLKRHNRTNYSWNFRYGNGGALRLQYN